MFLSNKYKEFGMMEGFNMIILIMKTFPSNQNCKTITCFLTTNDITGGNSGSPVINGNGELIGIAFDGNWEAMSGDIAFETELQRTINVDIRYVLFIIDKYAGATRPIDELTIRKSEPKPIRTEAF